MNNKVFLIAWALACAFHFSNAQYNSFKKLGLDMESKTASNGYTSTTQASIYYANDGSMVSYYKIPKEYIVLNNAKGEIKIYDPEKNTVLQQQNYLYSTETSQFYFFLNNKKSDLGLAQMGFVQNNLKFEEDYMISEWLPPAQMAKMISRVELVHEKGQPIYIAYYDKDNKISNKSYYYNYQQLNPTLDFPATVTKIVYSSPTDSTVTKTSYLNIKLDSEVKDQLLNYSIPNDAKNIE